MIYSVMKHFLSCYERKLIRIQTVQPQSSVVHMHPRQMKLKTIQMQFNMFDKSYRMTHTVHKIGQPNLQAEPARYNIDVC